MNFAILASTNGSDLPAIVAKFKDGSIKGQIVCGVVNVQKCRAQEKLEAEAIPVFFVDHTGKQREDFDREVSKILEKYQVDYVVCVGYMRILSPWFVKKWSRKIINVHPALLPNFPGAHAIQDALDAGGKETGATVHFIDEGVDTGPILMQKKISITSGDTFDSLKQKIQAAEQEIYPKVLEMIAQGTLF